jgi:transcription initiation factor IIE alpha subunit
MNCLLCATESNLIEELTFLCSSCGLVFKNPLVYFSSDEDVKRYSSHQNNKDDQGYIDFLNKLVKPLAPFLPAQFKALDFGCGPGPTLSLLLTELGGVVENYDPLFLPNNDLLKMKFEVVTSTEVVEHFKNPKFDWGQLVERVSSNGLLAIMTQFLQSESDYKSWWYKKDPTHVVFYQEKTFQYLAKEFNLEILYNDKKSIIIFRNREAHL